MRRLAYIIFCVGGFIAFVAAMRWLIGGTHPYFGIGVATGVILTGAIFIVADRLGVVKLDP